VKNDLPAFRRSPTRRGFVMMLGATAAILAVRDRYPIVIEEDDLPPRPSTGTTRWIGHG
jgi:hypothetical protein